MKITREEISSIQTTANEIVVMKLKISTTFDTRMSTCSLIRDTHAKSFHTVPLRLNDDKYCSSAT